MATRQRRGWQIDWAGPHGTAWGTVNACLSTLSAACLGRLTQIRWPVPTTHMVLAAIVLTVLGVIWVLLRAALRRRHTPGVTILYKACCWAGAGGWLVHMFAADEWTWRWFIASVGALAGMAIVAGALAALASDDPPQEQPETSAPAEGTPQPDAALAERNTQAVEWEARLQRICQVQTTVPNIERWERGNGYTVEAVCPEGGTSWRTIAAKADEIADDLDLEAGCRVGVQMGPSRRVALIDVLDVNSLHEEQPYPEDYGPLSILDPLPGAVRDDGSEIGPDLRSKCMLIVGESGSGKTNAGHNVGVGVARCGDALLWDLDFTHGLFLDLLHPYMTGRAKQPAVDWAAWDEREGLLMTRAAKRGHIARKTGYRDLMRDANDDKVPISEHIPGVIMRLDEIAPITGAPSRFPTLNENIREIVFEARSAGFRAVLLGLRATADIVGTDIQAQCHVIAVLRAKADAEYAWAFGWHSGAHVTDAPYPGCGFISLESGARPVAEKWRRLRPKQLIEAAVAVDGRQPEMDELTRLALDGRGADGTPMEGLLPGELDCYSTRWARFRDKFGGDHPSQPAPPAAAPAAVAAGPVASPAQAMADLAQTMADLDRAVQEAKAQQPGQGAPDGVRDEFDRILAAEGFGPDVDWSDPDNWASLPESEPQPGDADLLLQMIRAHGPDGVAPRVLRDELRERHRIRISRDTLHERLRELKQARRVFQPSHGKWAAGGGGPVHGQ